MSEQTKFIFFSNRSPYTLYLVDLKFKKIEILAEGLTRRQIFNARSELNDIKELVESLGHKIIKSNCSGYEIEKIEK